ncbi:MAG: hypothetical protein IPH88_19300 [Bacteroidales bacterium]|nr:hypothetical protein [Bacteroidales bacterium]
MPEKQNDKYLIIPDQAEVRTLKKINATATFFKQKKINLAFFGNYDENYSTRENLTNIQSTNIHFGSSLGYNNKVLPFQIDLHSRKWVEEEIQTKRTYKLDQKIATIRLSKSLGRRDRNEFSFNHDENVSINQNALRISNTMDMFDFTHHLQLDSKQKYNLSTYISNLNQSGNLKIKRFMASETVTLELPLNLSSHNTYSYYNINQPFSSQQQNSLNSSLQHKLYKSLVSRINFNLNHIKHTVFKELNTKSGFELNYSKKIPTGQLLVSYRYDRYHFRYESDPVILNISNEQYSLTDGKITLLRLSGINAATVLVKDITGTLIFLEGVDYIIIQQNNYIEIRRIPGGAISNGSTVLIDYSAQQAGNYSYDANMHSFNTDVYILNNKLAFYYRFGTQDYFNLIHTGQVTLNYFTQHISGIRVDFDFVNAGVEYEVYKSSILPTIYQGTM